MRLIYKHEHEGVWFSKNWHKAYIRGERPACLLGEGKTVEATVPHHIARQRARGDYSREYVVFYRITGVAAFTDSRQHEVPGAAVGNDAGAAIPTI